MQWHIIFKESSHRRFWSLFWGWFQLQILSPSSPTAYLYFFFFSGRLFLMRFYCIFKNWNGSRANHEEEKSIVYDGCYTLQTQKLPHNYPEFALMVENRMLSSLLMAICWDTSHSLSPKICKPQFVFPEEFWCGEMMIIVISGALIHSVVSVIENYVIKEF